ncbi:MAG TPA: hypothetical protein VIL72_10010 [Beijerinckiaceae bacterium]|jgi:hypothetical protein
MTQEELVAEAVRLAGERATPDMSPDDKDELLEKTMLSLLDRNAMRPFFGKVGLTAAGGFSASRGLYLMHDEPRLPKMPEAPTLMDFFKKRVLLNKRGGTHLLQSAALAMENGLPDKLVLACLLHDIAVVSHVRSDHGYYGAQLIEPYVDEETVFAVRYHQALRFYPDESVGYEYPDLYLRAFGEDYKPPAYIQEAAEYAKNHKWYMSARLVTTNDLYSFDPDKVVEVEQFEDVIGRCWKQPKEGLGFDNSPSAHMWRSIIWPNNFL